MRLDMTKVVTKTEYRDCIDMKDGAAIQILTNLHQHFTARKIDPFVPQPVDPAAQQKSLQVIAERSDAGSVAQSSVRTPSSRGDFNANDSPELQRPNSTFRSMRKQHTGRAAQSHTDAGAGDIVDFTNPEVKQRTNTIGPYFKLYLFELSLIPTYIFLLC